MGCQTREIDNHINNYPYEKELVDYLEAVHQIDLKGESWVALIPIPNCSGCTADILKICIENPSMKPVILNSNAKDMLYYQKLIEQLPHAKRDSTDEYFNYDTGIYGATVVRFDDKKLEFFRELNTGNAPEVGDYIHRTIE